MIESYQMYIYGAFCDPGDGQRIHSINPAPEEVWAIFADHSPEPVVDLFVMR